MRPSAASPCKQVAYPQDALGIQTVHRFVQQQRARIAEQGRRDSQPLAHAERKAAGPLACDLFEPDQAQHLIDPPARNLVGGGHGQKMVASRSPGVHGTGLQQRPDLTQRCREIGVSPAVDQGASGARPVQPEQQPHGGRLACTVRSEEPGDHARPDVEAQVVDRGLRSIPLGQAADLDHENAPEARTPYAAISGTVTISCGNAPNHARESATDIPTTSPR